MKLRYSLFFVSLFLAGCATPARPLPTVARVDLPRYAGRWYEVARLPTPFQRNDSGATAEYTLNADRSVCVLNTELRPDGTKKAIEGRATVVPGSGGARLRVRFKGLASLVPVPASGNYWIVAIKPDYSAAMVGLPDRKYLWLLSRTPKSSPATRTRLIERARELGFPVGNLLYH